MKPVKIDVFYPLPEGWGMCNPCELMMSQASLVESPASRGLDEYPPELQQEFQQLSAMIYTLADRYQDQVQIKVWDPRSLQGLLKSIRYGVRRYPTFIINGQAKFTGFVEEKIDQRVRNILET